MTTIDEIKNRLAELSDDQLDRIYTETFGHKYYHLTRAALIDSLQKAADKDRLKIPDSVYQEGF